MSSATYVRLDAAWGEKGWFRFPNSFIRDQRLTWNARGIAAWMASHDPGFAISVQHIIKAGPLGRDGVHAALRVLEQAGYLTRRQDRRPDGTLGPVEYCLRPEPAECDAPASPHEDAAPRRPTPPPPAPATHV